MANRLWKILRGHRFTLLVLLFLLVLETVTLFLPQAPVAPHDRTAFVRWIAELRPRLGPWSKVLAVCGLLNVKSSLPFRLILGALGMIIAAHIEHLSSQERSKSHQWRRSALIAVGGLLVLTGWGIQMLWGWQETEVLAWPDTDLNLPARQISLPQPEKPVAIWPTRYGLYVLQRGARLGIEVQAHDEDGQLVRLLPAVNQPAQATLRFILSPQVPEAFFATHDSQLICRLNQPGGTHKIQLQIYRSPSGQLVRELYLTPTAPSANVTIEGLELVFAFHRLPQYEVIYNPGALMEGVGLLALVAAAWVGRRPQASVRAPG